MNIIKRIVKETALIPYRIVKGVEAAVEEVVEGKEEKEKR